MRLNKLGGVYTEKAAQYASRLAQGRSRHLERKELATLTTSDLLRRAIFDHQHRLTYFPIDPTTIGEGDCESAWGPTEDRRRKLPPTEYN